MRPGPPALSPSSTTGRVPSFFFPRFTSRGGAPSPFEVRRVEVGGRAWACAARRSGLEEALQEVALGPSSSRLLLAPEILQPGASSLPGGEASALGPQPLP